MTDDLLKSVLTSAEVQGYRQMADTDTQVPWRCISRLCDTVDALRAENEELKQIVASLVPAPIVDSGGRNIE